MEILLRPLTENENEQVFTVMSKKIPAEEHGFENHAHGLSEQEFKKYIISKVAESKGENLSEGYVPQTHYLLMVDGLCVGFSKLRHYLTEALLEHGGHIGYGINPDERGKKYGNLILAETLKKAKEMELSKVLLTCEIDNIPSWKVIERNGGVLEKEENGNKFYWIGLS